MGDYFENEKIKVSEVEDLSSKEFVGCTFEKENLQEQSLKYSKFIECKFVGCNLSNMLVR